MEIPGRIVVIDDDSINNMYCKYIIDEVLDSKVEIIMFTNPKKALEYINTEYTAAPIPTLMFLDINMPQLSGWNVLEELERSDVVINDYFNVYMLSSSVDPNDRARAQNSKFVRGFLEKPLDIDVVKNICGIT